MIQQVFGQFNDFCFFHIDKVLVHDSKDQRSRSETKAFEIAFFKRYLQYLGHQISSKGIHPLKEKVAIIVNLVLPWDVTEKRHIIGLTSYYRKFIVNFSDIVKPLTEPIKNNTTFKWSSLCQLPLNTIKTTLMYSPILIFPDPNAPYILFTDTSKHSWLGVLTQELKLTMKGKDSKSFLPILYISGPCVDSLKNWATLTKDAYVIYMAFKKLPYYLYNVKVSIKYDHAPTDSAKDLSKICAILE